MANLTCQLKLSPDCTTPEVMLDAWMGKAADALCNGQAPVRTSEPIPVIGGRDNAPGRLPHTMEARP